MTTRTLTLIDAFDVPADADAAFIADWKRARESGASGGGYRSAALHRALRTDVAFRFVEVALVDQVHFQAQPGLYEVVREDGTPDIAGGVVLIDPFEVPDDQDELFLAGWDRARDVLGQQRGYLGARLYRSIGPADFRFVDIARWSSPLMFARALKQPEVQRAAQALPFPSHPALYQVVTG